jgi:hypothetical protein
MTTFFTTTKRCGNCGAEDRYQELGSSNSFGSPDLDQRPPGMMRDTLSLGVQRCGACGYCDEDVAKVRQGSGAVVAGAEYRRLLEDPALPELARMFRCKALLELEDGDCLAAAWALIHAAWACDDEDAMAQAAACRRAAVEAVLRAEGLGKHLYEDLPDATTAMLVDLLRRAGDLDEARALLAARRGGITDDAIARILDFHAALIDKGDAGRHTLKEALGEQRREQSN